ncbi:hypothetical protein T440DRAFT_468353 [Plenodomus tracheiphilus IPT5]|uniref:Uncharacterized protein n=1 Tax=Plenodomus tracheiphilus IPT5 TaxID=1408161 RepID=A0A6A7B980_9PLEO|nr:hypothetical protein T440DRAFT_468353 [Plenodomus tracheiphilus IPT5]
MSSDLTTEVAQAWMSFNPATTQNLKITGAFSPQDKTVVFTLGSMVGTAVQSRYNPDDFRSGIPIFSKLDGTYSKLTFTYTEVKCPAKCVQANAQSSSIQPTPVLSKLPSSTPPSWVAAPSSSMAAPQPMSSSLSKSAAITPYPSSTTPAMATPTPSSDADNNMAPCGGLGPNGKKNFYGFDYEIFCGATGSTPVAAIDSLYLPSFAACINYCTGNGSCKAVMFQEIAPKGNNYKCTRYSSLGRPGEGLDWTGTFDVAYRS